MSDPKDFEYLHKLASEMHAHLFAMNAPGMGAKLSIGEAAALRARLLQVMQDVEDVTERVLDGCEDVPF